MRRTVFTIRNQTVSHKRLNVKSDVRNTEFTHTYICRSLLTPIILNFPLQKHYSVLYVYENL